MSVKLVSVVKMVMPFGVMEGSHVFKLTLDPREHACGFFRLLLKLCEGMQNDVNFRIA